MIIVRLLKKHQSNFINKNRKFIDISNSNNDMIRGLDEVDDNSNNITTINTTNNNNINQVIPTEFTFKESSYDNSNHFKRIKESLFFTVKNKSEKKVVLILK